MGTLPLTEEWPGIPATLIDLLPDPVIVVDPVTRRVVFANEATYRLLGYPRTDLVGMPLADLSPEETDADRDADLARLMAGSGEERQVRHVRLRSVTGDLIDCESHAQVILDPSGRPLLVCAARDVRERLRLIDERRRLVAQVRDGEAFRVMFESAPVGASLIRVGRRERERIVRANQALARMLGEPVESLPGMDPADFTLPEDSDVTGRILRAVATGRLPEASGVRQLRRRDGSRVWVEMRVVPVEVPGIEGRLVLGYHVDVTGREEALRRQAAGEAAFRALFEQTPVGTELVRALPDGTRRVLWANQALADLFGVSVDSLIGPGLQPFHLPEDLAADTEHTARVAAGKSAATTWPKQYRRPDGSRLWAEVRVAGIDVPGEDDGPGRLAVAHVVDVTERHREAERRARRSAVNALVAAVATQVLAGQALAQTYRQVVHGVAEAFDAQNAGLALPDPGTGRLAVVAAVGPMGADLLTCVQPTSPPFLDWFSASARRRDAAALQLPYPAQCVPPRRGVDLGSALAAAFRIRPGAAGALSVARAREREPFDDDDRELLRSLAHQVALAIQLGQAQSQLRRDAVVRDQYLSQLERTLRPLANPERIQEAACRLLGRHLRASRVLLVDVDDHRTGVVRHQYLDGVAPMPVSFPIEGEAVIDQDGRAEPLIIDDLARDPRVSAAKRAARRRTGVAAMVIVPLVKQGRWFASLGVHTATPRRWTSLEVQLIRDTAERTWAAVERSLAEQAAADERERRVEAERQLVEQVERERRERLEQDFITNAAHELRTPLAGILAALDTLEAGAKDDPAGRRQFLDHMRHEAVRLARLSDSLLLLAQAQSVGPLPAQPVAVPALLDAIAAGLPVADGVTVSVEADPDVRLHAHPGLAEVLIGNLAANAAKYTRDGRIVLSADARDAAVVVEVRDTGPGMEQQVLARAKDRYYRHVRGRAGDGFGLGLSIASQAATALGARLDLDSSPGSGTRARVTFPAAHPPEPQDPRG